MVPNFEKYESAIQTDLKQPESKIIIKTFSKQEIQS
jgi:hypothetical protein